MYCPPGQRQMLVLESVKPRAMAEPVIVETDEPVPPIIIRPNHHRRIEQLLLWRR